MSERLTVGDAGVIDAAVAAIKAGELIVIPTDTVFGIAADALNPDAVQALLDAKGRGRQQPPPVMVAEPFMLRSLGKVTPEAKYLAETFWPGALTLVIAAHPELHLDLGDRGETIAVRVPNADWLRELLRQTGPLAVSSANLTGQPAAHSAADAEAQLGESVALYVDETAGAAGQLPSTIVDVTVAGAWQILREGALSETDIQRALPPLRELFYPEAEAGA
ncbi:MAG: threonylcarbamoyl-AMP synthase [Propionibacteriaceae bacterium]|nr:threonylcarbamoyl-AMP synthase [Propionibacteriaceae bacterium]